MREPAPDFSSGPYERVNQPWVCGLASEGSACPAGPTAHGVCPALADCTPLRDGDRWQCNRSTVRGGICDNGPTPEGKCGRVHRCRPVRSLRAVRGQFVAACALLTAGGLAIVLGSSSRDRILAPGPLASPHAQLLAQPDGTANCAACHSAAETNVAGWTATLVAGHGDGPTQSELCMKCHGKTISPALALSPHNVSAEFLRGLTEARVGTAIPAGDQTAGVSLTAESKVACATCHREHQGPGANLAAMDNAACQACHHERYESFAIGHPDFGNWPYERRTRIAFNHASHRSKHFTEKKQTFDCRNCHLDDLTHAVQLAASYEAACAQCHDGKIATSIAQGVPMLAVPTLDVEALKAAGHDIGPWPKRASGDFDGRLPPMMKLLLAADPAAEKAMETLGEDFEFLDVDPDDPNQLAACAELATAIKAVLVDVSQRGPASVRERLSATLGRDMTEAEVAALMAGWSLETMSGIAEWWLGAKITDKRAVNESGPLVTGVPKWSVGPPGAWLRDDATLTIAYRPATHADPVLTGWLQLLADTPDLAQQPLAVSMFKELSVPTAPGLCASCHSVEQTASGTFAVNWRAYDRTAEPRRFTKFLHGPHLILPQLAGCTQCHALNDAAVGSTSYVESDPHRFVSDFLPMSKQRCAECHTKQAAGDSCQSCHNYHVEENAPASVARRLLDL